MNSFTKTKTSIDTSITKSIQKHEPHSQSTQPSSSLYSTLYTQISPSPISSFKRGSNSKKINQRNNIRNSSFGINQFNYLTITPTNTPLTTEPNQVHSYTNHKALNHRNKVYKSSKFNNSNIIKTLIETLKSSEHKISPNKVSNKCLNKNPHKLNRILPVITQSGALNKFLIREYKPVTDTPEYIQSTRNRMYIAEKFFTIKQKNIRNKTQCGIEAFEYNKARNIFNDDPLTYYTMDSKEIERKQYRLMTCEDMEEIKKKSKVIMEEKIKEEGVNIANRLLELEPYENLEGENCRRNNFEICKKNLNNTIAKRRIMKTKGNYNTEDDALGILNVNTLKHERKETEYEMIKIMHCFKGPNFLKQKFGKETIKQYKSVNGKFFGVIC